MTGHDQIYQGLLEELDKLIASNVVFGHRKKGPGGRGTHTPTAVVTNLYLAERATAIAMAAHILGNYDWPVITGGPLADQLRKETVFEYRLPGQVDGLPWKRAATAAFAAWAKAVKPGDTQTRFRLQLVRTK